MVVPGETFPATRGVDDEVEATEMTGLEHLGQYVYEMTQAKIKQLDAGQLSLPPPEKTMADEEDEENIVEAEVEEDEEVEEPPLPEEMVT